MSNCLNCGAALKPGAKFCPSCGTRVEDRPSETCPACSRPVPTGVKFCPGCGAALSGGGKGNREERNESEKNTNDKSEDKVVRTERPVPPVGPRRSTACPKCGRPVQPDKAVCPYCQTRLRNPVPPVYEEREVSVRESKGRTGLWIALAVGFLVLAGIAAALLIFWEDLFGTGEEPAPTAPVNYGSVEPAETKDRPGLAHSDAKPTGTEEPRPARPETEGQEATAREYTWEELRTMISLRYEGDIVKTGEESGFCYAEVRDPATGNLRYVLRADRRTGEITVAASYPEPTASESIEDGVPEEERTNLGAVREDTIRDYMASRVSKTTYSYTVVDLNTGNFTGSGNQEDPMSSSVLIGIPVMYAVNKLAAEGTLSLSQKINIQDLGGGGRGAMTSSTMTVEELLQYMLKASSGAAINNLASYIGMDRINRICRDAGYDSVSYVNYIASPSIVDYTSSDNYVSTRDLCGMLYELYNGDGVIDRRFLENNFGITVGTEANDGLGKRVEGTIGSFNGRKDSKYNDLILVRRDGRVYAVAMMAYGDKYTAIMNAMDGVGKYIDGKLME